MIALILGVLSRDAYRRHAYASVVRMQGGGESNTTVVVMPPSGMAMLAAGEGSFVSSTSNLAVSYGGAPAFNSLGYGVPAQIAGGYQQQ